MNFTELINQLRKERGLSVDELARRSGVPKGTLSKLTAGISTNPTISPAEAILSAMDCSFTEIAALVENELSAKEVEMIRLFRKLDPVSQKAVYGLLLTEPQRQAPAWAVPDGEFTQAAARSDDRLYHLRQQPDDDQLAQFEDITDSDI